jgi:hypothetical protein
MSSVPGERDVLAALAHDAQGAMAAFGVEVVDIRVECFGDA